MDRNANSRTNHSQPNDRESRFLLRKIVMDFFILFCVGFLILVFYLWGTPYKRGFFCDDESLKHPFKDSTVTNVMLYIVGLGLPVLTMCLTEWIRLRDFMGGRSRTIFGVNIPAWAWEAYKVIGVFLFGCACQQLTTDIAKYTIGRLRPHFFDVCKPDIDCNLPENRWRYIEDFKCNGADEKLMKEMRLSFPSGHSSFSAYTMLYFSMYLQKRFTWRGSKLLRHGLQFVLVMLAWYTVMTRVSDYKHHWSDVLAGFSIGLLYAVIIFTFVSDLRKSVRMRPPARSAELHVTNGTNHNTMVHV
ncbi:putative phosphatidate phosphatase [Amyelois transitella]|uniref:putative phosphatidate phosphatase n=1 Tax=Amyelois transitella TaxID=680683 RepID=UPI00067D4545|nr:putative phosphatidate phosphatase [Amyelois transitella]